MFEAGQLTLARDLDPGKPVPLPARHDRSLGERQGILDAATTERLRVLSTEVRRLSTRAIPFELVLAPRLVLQNPGAARLFCWI